MPTKRKIRCIVVVCDEYFWTRQFDTKKEYEAYQRGLSDGCDAVGMPPKLAFTLEEIDSVPAGEYREKIRELILEHLS